MAKSKDRDLELTRAMTHILVVLAGGERHGYAIMTEIARLTDNEVRIGPATLYRSINQLLKNALIEETDDGGDEESEDERRKYYKVTDSGRKVVEAEVRRLEKLVLQAHTNGLLTLAIPTREGES
jgi:DNA-binding PadR family transcriptional regulator